MKPLRLPATLALSTALVAAMAAIVIVGTVPGEGTTSTVAGLSAAQALSPAPSR